MTPHFNRIVETVGLIWTIVIFLVVLWALAEAVARASTTWKRRRRSKLAFRRTSMTLATWNDLKQRSGKDEK